MIKTILNYSQSAVRSFMYLITKVFLTELYAGNVFLRFFYGLSLEQWSLKSWFSVELWSSLLLHYSVFTYAKNFVILNSNHRKCKN